MFGKVYFIIFSILVLVFYTNNKVGNDLSVTNPANFTVTATSLVQDTFSNSFGTGQNGHFRPKNAIRTKARDNTIAFDFTVLPVPELKLLHDFKPCYFGYSVIIPSYTLTINALRGPPVA